MNPSICLCYPVRECWQARRLSDRYGLKARRRRNLAGQALKPLSLLRKVLLVEVRSCSYSIVSQHTKRRRGRENLPASGERVYTA